ncbi:MAG TPA: hypothetical protein VFQ61_18480 [Polyangiaceae bacterium]|nr:hypothetical protein [Polyangiaceae bacterium]
MRARAGVLALAAWLGGFAVACSGEDGPPSSADIACGGLCEAAFRCGLNPDRANCRAACTQDSSLSAIPRHAAQAYGQCVQRLSCAALDDQTLWNEEFKPCFLEELYRAPVTQRAKDFCALQVELYLECGWLYPRDVCEMEMSIASDAEFSALDACRAREECSEYKACNEAVFE